MKRKFIMVLCFQLLWLPLALPTLAGHDSDRGGKASAKSIGISIPLPANPSRWAVLGPGMGFPFKNSKAVREMRAYGIRPWGGEPVHNGIDIIVDNTGAVLDVGDRVPVVSPVRGTVKGVLHLENPHNPATPQWILVGIAVNPGLLVTLSFEPQTENVDLQALQARSIDVVAGQRVRKGQVIGALVVGEGGESPHRLALAPDGSGHRRSGRALRGPAHAGHLSQRCFEPAYVSVSLRLLIGPRQAPV
jgi:hypothetical protein